MILLQILEKHIFLSLIKCEEINHSSINTGLYNATFSPS